jgi:hypothetical protein
MRRAILWLLLWIGVRSAQKQAAALQRPASGIFIYPGRPVYSVLCVLELLALLAVALYLFMEGVQA